MLLLLFLLSSIIQTASLISLQDLAVQSLYRCDNEDSSDWSEKIGASFWRHSYCKLPIVFRKSATDWPAFASWTDSYLGNSDIENVTVELDKKENRQQTKTTTMNLKEFIDGYQQNNWYLVHNLLNSHSLRQDVKVPHFLANDCCENTSVSDFASVVSCNKKYFEILV